MKNIDRGAQLIFGAKLFLFFFGGGGGLVKTPLLFGFENFRFNFLG